MCADRDSSKGVISVSEIPDDSALKYKKSGQALECCMPIKGILIVVSVCSILILQHTKINNDLAS